MAGKASKILKKVKKDLKLKRRGNTARRFVRRNATSVLAQGAVTPPRRIFGTVTKANARSPNVRSLVKCLDARIPRTLGLPRAVGPYTVIRTTVLHQSAQKFVMFSPFMDVADSKPMWRSWCGVESVTSSSDVRGTGNTAPIPMPLDGLGTACEVVPAALTVQVMNPDSVQTAHGIFAMVRMNQGMSLGGTPAGTTYDDMATRIIEYNSPRLLTGGRLALRGVKCSAYPLDMTEYSSFSPIKHGESDIEWNTQRIAPAALSPIVFINQNANTSIRFMVTIEWRVRFDPSNPAIATHVHHDTLSDEAWNQVVKTASSAGHGVEELAEDAAGDAAVLGIGMMMA